MLFFILLKIINNLFWSKSCLVSCMKAPQMKLHNRDDSLHEQGELQSAAPLSGQNDQGIAQIPLPNIRSDKVIESPITSNAPKETYTGTAKSPLVDLNTETLPIAKKTDDKAQNSTQKGQVNVIFPNNSENAKVSEHDEEKEEMEFMKRITSFEEGIIKKTEDISGNNIIFSANKIPSECLEKVNRKSFIFEDIFSEEKLENISGIFDDATCYLLRINREITLDEL